MSCEWKICELKYAKNKLFARHVPLHLRGKRSEAERSTAIGHFLCRDLSISISIAATHLLFCDFEIGHFLRNFGFRLVILGLLESCWFCERSLYRVRGLRTRTRRPWGGINEASCSVEVQKSDTKSVRWPNFLLDVLDVGRVR